jgi:hypothetical protein
LRQGLYVAQVSLEIVILLPPSLECWDSKCVPPRPTLFARFLKEGKWKAEAKKKKVNESYRAGWWCTPLIPATLETKM